MSAETSDEMQELAEKMMPLLSEHSNNISLNEKLFARIKAVYEQKDQLQRQYTEAKRQMQEYGIIKQNVDGILRTAPGKEQMQER